MSKGAQKVDPSGFVEAFSQRDSNGLIWFADDLLWHARVDTPVGSVELAKPDQETGYPNLEGLLSVLAGVGIRKIEVEWDGLPAFNV
ncbi:MAG: hypothetical protein V4713_03600 [Pseudomonadota bacterium]